MRWRLRLWLGLLVALLVLSSGGISMDRVHGEAAMSPILSGSRFPIGLWWPPPPEATNTERYREIAEAGFNFVIGGNRTVNEAHSRRMLEAAEPNGIQVIVTDERVERRSFSRRFIDDERAHIESVIDDYKSYPAFAGLNFFDEPGTQLFSSLAVGTEIFRELAPGKIDYVNLFPSYVVEGSIRAPDYETYIARFISEVKPPVLSFDHYPLLTSGDSAEMITDDYFYNWAVIREAALGANIPSWVFIQSIDYAGHRRPTETELRWQVNVSLAYGAKGIMYFTYWTPFPPGGEKFGTALISADGTRTDLYDAARRVNRELAAVGRQLLSLSSVSVTHTEHPLPSGTVPFAPDEWVASVSGSPLIIGQFAEPSSLNAPAEPSQHDTTRWLLLVNRSFTVPAASELNMAGGVASMSQYDPDADEYVSVELNDQQTVEVKLDPGAAVLYRLATELF